MITRRMTIENPLGLHAAYAARLAAFARKSGSSIFLRKKGKKLARAADMVAVLGMLVRAGDELEILVDGLDEIEDMQKFMELIISLDR
ncbi:HPr family phosphocarrier protein [Pectinatus haikarae]|uniref:Phosphotransferase system HPr (HPr) family protein n=1 Tax=Pectinatus haikarae TaxID=349096 RepID=A0ABT9Y7Y4_9FIRM|nr:HPr family phosphocarrier protein [Pectinatus haikarae]MDQ0203948.1 phosphotransferase system HPr (HPr) family protein [Pectinatus haikarae]